MTLLLLWAVRVDRARLTSDLCLLQVSVATRRTHCAVVAVAALTTSRRAHALAAATLLPGRGHVSTSCQLGYIAAAGWASGGYRQQQVTAAAAAHSRQTAAAQQHSRSGRVAADVRCGVASKRHCCVCWVTRPDGSVGFSSSWHAWPVRRPAA